MVNFRKLTDRSSVLEAIAEFNVLGRDGFLGKYGFGKARSFFLIYEGRQYDSKAIVGAAYAFQHGVPLRNSDFSGGKATVVPKMEELGFRVVATNIDDATVSLAEEVPDTIVEGARRTVSVNAYERSAQARTACIEAHGSQCFVCDFNFGHVYGDEFTGFIHVHHKVPLANIGEEYEVNPESDLVPLCPNCHAVVHFGKRTRTVEEVQAMFRRSKC